MKEELNKFLLSPNITIKDAMKALDNSNKMVLFIVDESKKLVGSFTDGDLRKWILKGGNIDQNILLASNNSPFYIYENYIIETVKKEFHDKKIFSIPVLSADNTIKDILFWDEISDSELIIKEKKNINCPVVIMAGGLGTRLEPFTNILPKPLIPVGDKTIIELIIDKFLEYDVNDFIITINHKPRIIKSYFEELNPSYNYTLMIEDKPYGTAGCLSKLKNKYTSPFIVTNCDIIINADYLDLLNFHNKSENDITLVASIISYKIPYGICNVEEGGNLINILEKPEYNYLISTGMYVLEPDILELIPENEFYNMTTLIKDVKNNGGKVGVYPISEKLWLDVGDWKEYKKSLDIFKHC